MVFHFKCQFFNVIFVQIEFYRNGAACGTAFSDIYAGAYYPAISLYRNASVRCNFGPHFRYGLPANARSFHERAEEMHIDQAMADLLYFVENETLLR
jgi:Set1/Ash2 histone methyltransferase complex subunit ASH2